MVYIYHHLGLGDHIICNGLVRSLINDKTPYSMFVKSHNLAAVEFMYRDLPNMSFTVGDDAFVETFLQENKIDNEHLIKIGFAHIPNAISFDDGFYVQFGLPFRYRWEKFHCVRDTKRELDLFEKYNVEKGEYIFLHEDKERGYHIDRTHIINKDLPIVSPVKGYTNNAFDYCYLMEHSRESHFIDSSFRLIFDSLQLRNSNLFYHINLLGQMQRADIKSQSILNFTMI